MKSYKRIILILMGLLSSQVYALDYGVEVNNRIEDLLRIESNTAQENATPNCLARYQNLYKDGVLNVALAFGYWDNSPNEDVFDMWIANGLRNNLVLPCTPGKNVCGFTRSGDTFNKIVKGPDGKLNRFSISISQGTLSPSNLSNTTTNRTQQYAKCEAQTNQFFTQVAKGSEVVMYIGHARNGGGPDLCPPVRDAAKHTNYPWYEKNRPGFNRLLSSMREAKKAGLSNQIVGLYSCYSKRHFYREMNALNPDVGYILTDVEISSQDAIQSVAATLDAVIGQKCSGFIKGLRLSNGVNMNGMFVK